jgi:hypothetical protein
MLHLTFFSSPSHGWLAVRADSPYLAGLTFSRYSFTHGGFRFLEEDCDAPLFLNHLRDAHGVAASIVDVYDERMEPREGSYAKFDSMLSKGVLS